MAWPLPEYFGTATTLDKQSWLLFGYDVVNTSRVSALSSFQVEKHSARLQADDMIEINRFNLFDTADAAVSFRQTLNKKKSIEDIFFVIGIYTLHCENDHV